MYLDSSYMTQVITSILVTALDASHQGRSLEIGGFPVLNTISYNASTEDGPDDNSPAQHQLSIVNITPQLIRAVSLSIEVKQYRRRYRDSPVDDHRRYAWDLMAESYDKHHQY